MRSRFLGWEPAQSLVAVPGTSAAAGASVFRFETEDCLSRRRIVTIVCLAR
jgi:hypothetical protein